MIPTIHLTLGFLSLFSGFIVLNRRKGTIFHISAGRVYVVSMLGLNITAFWIYRLFGGWGIFHWAALFSLATIISGILVILMKTKFKHPIIMHYYFMVWSYVGLLSATSNEIFVHVPIFSKISSQYPWLSMLSLAVITILGIILIPFNEKSTIKKYYDAWEIT